jgi:hypothetical protein
MSNGKSMYPWEAADYDGSIGFEGFNPNFDKLESFAIALSTGISKTEAYRKSDYAGNPAKACRSARELEERHEPHLQRRVTWLKDQAAKIISRHTDLNEELILDKLVLAIEKCSQLVPVGIPNAKAGMTRLLDAKNLSVFAKMGGAQLGMALATAKSEHKTTTEHLLDVPKPEFDKMLKASLKNAGYNFLGEPGTESGGASSSDSDEEGGKLHSVH